MLDRNRPPQLRRDPRASGLCLTPAPESEKKDETRHGAGPFPRNHPGRIRFTILYFQGQILMWRVWPEWPLPQPRRAPFRPRPRVSATAAVPD